MITLNSMDKNLKNFTKLEIKERLFTAGIQVPYTYMIINTVENLPSRLDFLMRNFKSGFVIKPNDGHSGKGIAVLTKVVGHRFITTQSEAWDHARLSLHIERILGGRFSRGRSDVAIVEERINQHYKLRNISNKGLIDFRLIVSHGYPVMGMARLPTERSRGKGNLHRGALGAGISLSEGVLTWGVMNDKSTTKHPDTGMDITGIRIPYWYEILMASAQAQYYSDLSYAGVDLVVDNNGKVKVLEVNRRPGLAIQLANKAGLRSRLEFIERLVNGSNRSDDNVGISIREKVDYVIEQDKNGWPGGGLEA
jgi:alpha-L-glutamate ligase-like protein